MKLRLVPTAALAALALLTAPAAAQDNPLSFGVQASLADDVDFGVGARATLGTDNIVQDSRVAASFDLFFPDDGGGVDVSYWEINLNGHYMLPVAPDAPVDFYAGAGLNFASISVDAEDTGFGDPSYDDTDLGLNLLGGIDWAITEQLDGYGEIRIELGGGEQIVFTVGLGF